MNFVAELDGVYEFVFTVILSNPAPPHETATLAMDVNGSPSRRGHWLIAKVEGDDRQKMILEGYERLKVGDKVEAYALLDDKSVEVNSDLAAKHIPESSIAKPNPVT